MSLSITFYNNSDDERVLNKTLTSGTSTSAELYSSSSVQTPTIIMAWNASYTLYNYMYIAEFNRYYYIIDVTAAPGGKAIVRARCDVLMSFKTAINALPAIVVRQSRKNQSGSNRSTWIEDSRLPIQAGKAVKAIMFENSDLNIDTADLTSNNFILNVAGGGAISNP